MTDEKTYVVDEHDVVIAEKLRSQVTNDERVRIVAVWVENSSGEVLIAQRAKTMSLDPGLWGPSAAGGVKAGHDYLLAAKEELSEEIGVDVDALGVTPEFLGRMVYQTEKNGKRMCGVFKVRLDWDVSEFTIEPTEVDQIKWISKADLTTDIENNPEKYLASREEWKNYLVN